MSTAELMPALVTNSETIQRRVADSMTRVCDVAAKLFNEDSFAAVSVEVIVREAGIARSSFYRFFPDKEALLCQIIEPVFDTARTQLERIDCSRPEEIINGIADSYLAVWDRYRDALQLSTKIGLPLFPLVRAAHDRYADTILELMRHVHDARMLRHDDPLLAARMLAQTTVPMLKVCEHHPQFANVFRATLRGVVLKW